MDGVTLTKAPRSCKKDEGRNKLLVLGCSGVDAGVYDDLLDGRCTPPSGWRMVSVSVSGGNAYVLLERETQ